MVTLFLGNGFDIDLGLKTKYSDFLRNNFPEIDHVYPSPMEEYLVSSTSQHWYDIEGICKDYAIKASEEAIDPASSGQDSIKRFVYRDISYEEIAQNDKNFFELLRSSLSQYIEQRLDVDIINKDSYAAYTLTKLVENKDLKLLTFNYTNIRKLLNKLNSQYLIPEDNITYIHGNCESNIILGTDEDISISSNYSFLFKSWHKCYESMHVIDYLNLSSDIIFFGLSFGNIDLVYFEPFFRRICNGDFDNSRKNITIFTYDESSRLSILFNLLKMGIKTMGLKNHCNLNFILTSPEENASQSDNQNFQYFLQYIRELK